MKKIVQILTLLCLSIAVRAQINAERLLDIGRNALYFEDYVVSIGYFNQVIEAKPYLTDPYYFRAIAKLYLEDFRGCIADCNSALDINPFLPKVYYLRGYAKRYIKEWDSSTDDMRRALEFEPDNKEVRIVIIENLVQQRLYKDAYDESISTIRQFPHYADTYLLFSQVLLSQNDTVHAEMVLDSALYYNKYSDLAYAMRGMLHFERKDYKSALSDLDQAVKNNGFRPDYLINRAIIKMQTNDLRGAMADFDQSIKLDNSNPNAYFNRALLKSEIGDDNNAIDDYTTCLALDPNNYTAYLQRAFLHSKLGEYKEAITDFNTVIAKYPDFIVAYYGRGDAKKKLRDRTGAEKDYYDAAVIEKEIKSGKRGLRKGVEGEIEPSKEARAIVQNLDKRAAEKYKSDIRGQVQYKDIDIEPLSNFVVAVADSSAKTFRKQLYNNELEKVNAKLDFKLSFCLADNAKTLIDFGGLNIVCVDALCFFNRGNERVKLIREFTYKGEKPSISACIAAINDLDMAYKVDQTIVYALYNIGYVYMLSKEFDEAIKYYSAAIEQYDRFAEAYYNRALIYISQGKKEEARRDLSKAGELGLYGAYNVMRRYVK